jgi:hypothetical protein
MLGLLQRVSVAAPPEQGQQRLAALCVEQILAAIHDLAKDTVLAVQGVPHAGVLRPLSGEQKG